MGHLRIRVSLTVAVALLILALAGTMFLVNVQAGREIADSLGDRGAAGEELQELARALAPISRGTS